MWAALSTTTPQLGTTEGGIEWGSGRQERQLGEDLSRGGEGSVTRYPARLGDRLLPNRSAVGTVPQVWLSEQPSRV